LELIGCLTAIAGGLFLGALYLGVDVKTTAMDLLRKSELIEPQWLEAGPDGSGSRPDESGAVPTEQAADGKESGIAVVGPESPTRAATAAGEQLERSPTRQFWHKLLQVMLQESEGRQEKDKEQLFGYLTARQQRHKEAADAIASLGQPRGVDERVLAYAVQTLQWHQSGVNLYQQAAQMLTFAPTSKWSGPFAQSWQSAATQHRMEEKLLLAKQNALSNYLDSPSFSDVPDR
jgi:hypothetical protein